MSALVRMPPKTITLNDERQLALVRRTYARDCTNDEFDIFIAMCIAKGLDPRLGQVFAFVFNKDDPAKRQLTIVTGIKGARDIAYRTGNYRPDEDEPEFTYDEALKGPTNPLGLVKAVVRIWQYSHGEWHRITGVAYWDEYAPVRKEADHVEWVETGEFWPDSGKPKKRKKLIGEVREVLDSSGLWPKMGRNQLAKCAEMNGLNKAWPSDFANMLVDAQTDRENARVLDLLPSEIAEIGATNERVEKLGITKNSVPMDFTGHLVEHVPMGQLVDRCAEYIRTLATPELVDAFEGRNRVGLRTAFQLNKNDGLEIRRLLDEAKAKTAAGAKAATEDQRELEGTDA